MTSPETEAPSGPKKGLWRELRGWLALAAVVGAIVALLAYVFFLEQAGRFVAPVACRGEFSADYEVDKTERIVAGGSRVTDTYMACISEDGERKDVRGPLIFGSLFVEITVVLFMLLVLLVRDRLAEVRRAARQQSGQG